MFYFRAGFKFLIIQGGFKLNFCAFEGKKVSLN